MWWAATVTSAAVLTVPAPRTPNWRPGGPQLGQPQLRWDTMGNLNEGQDVRGEVHNPQQAPPPSWKVAVPEQITAASSAYEVHGAFETHSGAAQATQAWNSQNVRQRDSADAQGVTTGSPVGS